MQVIKTYKFIGLDAFTLMLTTDLCDGNVFISSIPNTYLRANMDAHLKKLKYAYIPDVEIAFDWLNMTAMEILKLKKSYRYFYKIYLLKNKVIHRDIAEFILQNIESPQLQAKTHYSINNRPVVFFMMNSNVQAEWNIYRNSITQISVREFSRSLLSNEMKEDFERLIEDNCKAYVIKRSNKIKLYFLFTLSGRLLMLVNY
jgi:hypothetical protein